MNNSNFGFWKNENLVIFVGIFRFQYLALNNSDVPQLISYIAGHGQPLHKVRNKRV